MTSDDLRQITTARADFGRLTTADGRTIEFIDLHLGFLHQGNHSSLPALTMAPDQARTLAMHLLAAADKAQGTGRSGSSN